MSISPDRRHEVFGLVGWYDTPAELYHACEALRDAGYKSFDAHTPFPVHGLEDAMGAPPSKLGWVVLAMGTLGLASIVWLAWWTQAVDYAQNISGKDAFSWQAFVPIFFEVTVLFSGFGAFFGLWVVNGLPRFFHPVMQHPNFERATDDKFFISVESKDAKFDLAETRRLLEGTGAKEVLEVTP